MIRGLALAALAAAAIAQQTPATSAIFSLSAGLGCSAQIVDTDVVIECDLAGKRLSKQFVSIDSLLGQGSGYTVAHNAGAQSIIIQLTRRQAGDPLHITAAANGQPPTITKDLQIP